MSPTQKLGRDQVFHLLRSPVRRGIIRILGEKSQLSFTELRKSFSEISVGTLYYHLDLLDQIVGQDARKKYALTEEGRRVYAEILRSEEAMIPVKASVGASSGVDSVVSALMMRQLFSDISLRPMKYIFVPILVCLGIVFLGWISHSIQLLFFFISVDNATTLLIAASAVVSLVGVYSLLSGLSLLFFRRREGNMSLLIATSVGLVPLLIYPSVLILSSATIGQASLVRSPLNAVLTVTTQALSVLLIAAGLSQAKELRLDRSILIVLAAVYLNMGLLYFLGYVEV